jgi:membrane-associated phospholipid phosphatase
MRATAARVQERLLPRGPVDLLIQFAVIALAYIAWRYARGAVAGGMTESFAHARDLISVERSLGTLIEADVQRWTLDSSFLAEFVRWGYANLHFKGSCLMLAAIYFGWRGSFGFVRNMLLAAMAISVLCYLLYPTAPPRFIPELGLDPSSTVTGNDAVISAPDDPLFNPFAAVPSMHVAFSLMFAWSLALLVRRWPIRAALFAYPLVMTYVVVASGNHFWLDALFGAMVAAAAAGIAVALSRLVPDWSFRRDADRVPVRAPEPEVEAAPA